MKKENMIFIYDSETSYINEEQLLLPKGKRERYADSIYIRNINEEKGILFNDGKETMSNFTNYILRLSKEYNKSHNIKVGIHNLKYDSSYIVYFLNSLGYFNKKSLHNISIDTIDDGNMIYQVIISYSYRNKGKKNGQTVFRNYSVEFFDTYKLFPMSVDKMGKSLGFKKLDKIIDHNGNEISTKEWYNRIRDYNYRYNQSEKDYVMRDVDVVVEYYNKSPEYMKEKLTLASNAMNYYKSKFLPLKFVNNSGVNEDLTGYKNPFKYLFPNEFFNGTKNTRLGINKDGSLGKYNSEITMEECNNYFSKYYYGGVTMVNPIYKGKILVNKNDINKNRLIKYCKDNNREYVITNNREITLDINSLYPYIMDVAPLPYGEPIIIDYPSLKQLEKTFPNNFIFLDIQNIYGKLKDRKLPTIPKNKRDKLGAETLYKDILLGDSLGVNIDEWKLINRHYDICNYDIVRAYVFKSASKVIFSEYVKYFTELKVNSSEYIDGKLNPNYDECKRQNAKLMQNTLYGRFGKRIDKKSINKMFIDGEWTSIEKEETREQKYIYPIIASAITSYARQYMFSIIDSMDYEQFIYMDTDSIHMIENEKCNLETLTKQGLIDSANLGKLKHENSTLCSIYLAPKKYCFYDMNSNEFIIKCAGLPDDAKKQITTIENFYYGYQCENKTQAIYSIGGIDLVPCKYEIKRPNTTGKDYLNIVGV